MSSFRGKTVLITGAARGIGRAAAALFAREGASLALTDLEEPTAADLDLAAGGAAIFLQQDVTDEQRWADVVAETEARFGPLDILVNNAGVFRGTALVDTTLVDYQRIVEINQMAVFLGMRAAARAMIASARGGSIVNVSSVAGLTGGQGMFAYAASKWAVRGMSRSGAKELAVHGIRVNSVYPGTIATPMLSAMSAETRTRLQGRVPIGRIGTPDEAAAAILFLASDASSYMAGAELSVDGGITA